MGRATKLQATATDVTMVRLAQSLCRIPEGKTTKPGLIYVARKSLGGRSVAADQHPVDTIADPAFPENKWVGYRPRDLRRAEWRSKSRTDTITATRYGREWRIALYSARRGGTSYLFEFVRAATSGSIAIESINGPAACSRWIVEQINKGQEVSVAAALISFKIKVDERIPPTSMEFATAEMA